MIKQIDVVALVTAVLTSLGAAYTATLNFMHGRDDSREVIDFFRNAPESIRSPDAGNSQGYRDA